MRPASTSLPRIYSGPLELGEYLNMAAFWGFFFLQAGVDGRRFAIGTLGWGPGIALFTVFGLAAG